MPHGKIWMVQCLLAGDPLCGVKVEKLAEKIDGERVGTGEESLEWDARLDGQGTDVVLGLMINAQMNSANTQQS